MNIIWMSEEIVIYTADSVDVSLSIDSENDTAWASTQQIADLFDVDRTVSQDISRISSRWAKSKKKQCAENAHSQFRQTC